MTMYFEKDASLKPLQGKTVLTEQGLEDIIAYLLKNPS